MMSSSAPNPAVHFTPHQSFSVGRLLKIETWDADGHPQAPWRPRHVYHYVQDRYLTPDFVVDITPHWDRKREAITAFKSQFNVAPDGEPPTYISSSEFWQFLEGRARDVGHLAGFALGEAFLAPRKVGVKSVFDLV